MESSRALSRCLQQLSIHNQSCLRKNVAVATRRLRAQRNSSRHTTKLIPSSRPFSTSSQNRQDNPSPSNSQDVQKTQSQSLNTTPSPTQQSPLRAQPSRGIDLSSLVDNPDYKPPPRPQRAAPQNPNAAASNSTTTNANANTQRATNAQKIHSQLDAIVAEQRLRQAGVTNRRQPQQRQQSNYDAYGSGGTLFNQTRSPTRPAGPTPSTSDLAASMKNWVDSPIDPIDQKLLEETRELARAREQLRLHPSLGKTVEVNNESGFNITRALMTLEMKINGRGNSVRADERNQKYHVRRGQKKKLDKSRRWRILFKQGFLAECARIQKMRRQGW